MRLARPHRLALALLVAVTACGGNAEDKADFNRRKAICDGIVLDAAAPKTVRDIAPLFDFGQVLPSGCTNVLASTGTPDDRCPYVATANVCRFLVAYRAVDQDLCNQGRCVYYCELRTSGATATDINLDAPVCARRWVSGQ
ncbi:MAG: hypothetical protein ACJ79R_06205 [Anaeromyxobacteraceae bacterium]